MLCKRPARRLALEFGLVHAGLGVVGTARLANFGT